jgi:hypothetical protein
MQQDFLKHKDPLEFYAFILQVGLEWIAFGCGNGWRDFYHCHYQSRNELICNVETLLSFTCVLLFLELVQSLSKFAQSWITFIVDFIFVVKLCESNLQAMCNELEKRFSF